jgi:hypothetical protein
VGGMRSFVADILVEMNTTCPNPFSREMFHPFSTTDTYTGTGTNLSIEFCLAAFHVASSQRAIDRLMDVLDNIVAIRRHEKLCGTPRRRIERHV